MARQHEEEGYEATTHRGRDKGPVRLSDNPYFSSCFFSQNNIFLSQQISRNSVLACFFNEANEASIDSTHHHLRVCLNNEMSNALPMSRLHN